MSAGLQSRGQGRFGKSAWDTAWCEVCEAGAHQDISLVLLAITHAGMPLHQLLRTQDPADTDCETRYLSVLLLLVRLRLSSHGRRLGHMRLLTVRHLELLTVHYLILPTLHLLHVLHLRLLIVQYLVPMNSSSMSVHLGTLVPDMTVPVVIRVAVPPVTYATIPVRRTTVGYPTTPVAR
jgi:hypothetical protein